MFDHLSAGVRDLARAAAFYDAALAALGHVRLFESARAVCYCPRGSNYSPGYYAAFVVDPDGYRVEAGYHAPIANADAPMT